MKKKDIKNISKISDVLKIISHKDRLAILALIEDDSKDVSSLIKFLDLPQSTVSGHLALMKENKILSAKKKGRSIHYKVKDKNMLNLLNELKKIFI